MKAPITELGWAVHVFNFVRIIYSTTETPAIGGRNHDLNNHGGDPAARGRRGPKPPAQLQMVRKPSDEAGDN